MTASSDETGPRRSPAALRFPGGRLRPDHWTALAALAAAHRGDIRLTPRGGVRVVGQGAETITVAEHDVAAAGLPEGAVHSRARDIIASPMAGRLDGHHDLADLPDRLGAALLGHAGVDAVDGQVLFGVDDGSGDVLSRSPDLAVVADGTGTGLRVHVAGRDVSVRVPVADAATVLVDVAVRFAGSAGAVRVPGSGALHQLVVDVLGAHPLTTPAPDAASGADRTGGSPAGSATPVEVPRVGWVDTADGLVSLLAVVADGVVPPRLAEFLGAVERPSTISADRVIGLHELTEGMAEQVVRVLAPMGMIFDAESPWVTGSA